VTTGPGQLHLLTSFDFCFWKEICQVERHKKVKALLFKIYTFGEIIVIVKMDVTDMSPQMQENMFQCKDLCSTDMLTILVYN
jgi:hypothetical protein